MNEEKLNEVLDMADKIEDKDLPTMIRNAVNAIQDDSQSKEMRVSNAHGYVQHYSYNSEKEDEFLDKNPDALEFYNMIYDLRE